MNCYLRFEVKSDLISREIKTEGIILNQYKHKESSKILNVLTRDLGKIQIYAQGASKPKSELLLVAEPFSRSEFNLTSSSNFYYIKYSNLLDSHLKLRSDIKRLLVGQYFLELADRTLVEGMDTTQVYELLVSGLKHLEQMDLEDIPKLMVAYGLKYISFIGYRPVIGECVHCGSKNYDRMYFSSSAGGLICNNCLINEQKYVKLSKYDIEILNKMFYTKFSDLVNVSIDDESSLHRLHSIVVDYISYNTEIKVFKSLKLYDGLIF